RRRTSEHVLLMRPPSILRVSGIFAVDFNRFAADVCTRQRQTGFCMERLHVPARRLPYAGTWL
ncbi:hypothetical protein, partial [Bifidobacterium sp.]|uniref:hypothetical protein n=1 Tax=Bifidobacterium sp. TaxID=41200 RepID=UPI003D7F077E